MITTYVSRQVARVKTRVIHNAMAGLLFAIGTSMLGASALILLAGVAGWIVTLSVVGCALCIAGLVLLSHGRGPDTNSSHAAADVEGAAIVQAFLQGVQTGSAARARR